MLTLSVIIIEVNLLVIPKVSYNQSLLSSSIVPIDSCPIGVSADLHPASAPD